MKITVKIDADYKKLVYPVWLRAVALLVLNAEKTDKNSEMGLTITGDEQMHRLNREYLDEDRTTDVLSFPMNEPLNDKPVFVNAPDGKVHLGDVIISYPQAAKQAREHYHAMEREIAILTIHGILHLLGYDHDIPERERIMHEREFEILHIVDTRAL